MNGKVKAAVVFTITALLAPLPALAVPTLQIGIWDTDQYVGGYDDATDTTIAPGAEFVLRVLLNGSTEDLAEKYFISTALVSEGYGKIEENGADLGSFVFDGTAVDVTGDMIYGNPPANIVGDKYNLAPHNIFPTYYQEFDFYFDEDNTTPEFNVEKQQYEGDGDLYYMDFDVDLSAIAAGYTIHFDLYDEEFRDHKNYTGYIVGDFAPFSHDAEGGPPVPEPATLLLLGSGVTALAGLRRYRRNSA